MPAVPQCSAKGESLSEQLTGQLSEAINRRLNAEEREFLFLLPSVALTLWADFLQGIRNLLGKTRFGEEWLFSFVFWLLTSECPVTTGLLPCINAFIFYRLDGEPILRKTLTTTLRELKAAYGLLQELSANLKVSNSRLRRNQERDLKILEYSSQKLKYRRREREINRLSRKGSDEEERESDNERIYPFDADIQAQIFPPSEDAANSDWMQMQKTDQRQINVIRKARERIKKKIREMYNPS